MESLKLARSTSNSWSESLGNVQVLLEARIAREGAKAADPDDRFETADRMRQAISEVADRLPPPGPLTLAGIGAMGEDPHPTQVVRTHVESPLFDQDEVPPARVATGLNSGWVLHLIRSRR